MKKNPVKILVTGGAGFIGSEFVRQAVYRGYRVAVIDKLTYAGDRKRLQSVQNKITFYKTDIRSQARIEGIVKKERPQVIAHFAAETHVDRSIQDAQPFIDTNIKGTLNLINAARLIPLIKFIHISTDEVYGEIKRGKFSEQSPLNPNNPYSATKAAADLLIRSAVRTYHFPAIIVRPSNNYGPWQYPEKFIPVIILKAMRNQKVPVYGKGKNIREWLHVADCNKAIHLIISKGKIGETYNIGSNIEKQNIDTVKTILKYLKKPESLVQYVKDRPGHDLRYSLDCRKVKQLGWSANITFKNGMTDTLNWADTHFSWMEGKVRYLKNYWREVYQRI